MVFTFEDAMVCDLRKDFFDSTTVRIKSCIVHFLCWQSTFGTIARHTIGEGGTVEQTTQFLLGILHRHVVSTVVR